LGRLRPTAEAVGYGSYDGYAAGREYSIAVDFGAATRSIVRRMIRSCTNRWRSLRKNR